MSLLSDTVQNIGGLDEAAMAVARARQETLTKPSGSLGRLEALSVQVVGILSPRRVFDGRSSSALGKLIVVAAGDHGVAAEGVSAYPQAVTAQMVLNFLRGGAAINVLARCVGARVVVVDAGVVPPEEGPLPPSAELRVAHLGAGTANIARGPAMSHDIAVAAVEHGIAIVAAETDGVDLVATGDMGIANTTPSSAIVAAITGRDPAEVTGRGTGISDDAWRQKVEVVRRALAVNRPDAADAIDVLAKVGGFEIGVLAGVALGAAARRRVIVLDGFISGAAALIAHGLCPRVRDYCVASHLSVEPGHRAVVEHLGLTPLLNLDLRLGEGTGAALAMPIIEAAALCLAEMATFGEAGVSERDE